MREKKTDRLRILASYIEPILDDDQPPTVIPRRLPQLRDLDPRQVRLGTVLVRWGVASTPEVKGLAETIEMAVGPPQIRERKADGNNK